MTHTNTFHRFTAGLLCFIMVLTMTLTVMPTTVFAADDKNISIQTVGGSPVKDSGDGWSYDKNTVTIQKGYTLTEVWYFDERDNEKVGAALLGSVCNYGTIALQCGYCIDVQNKNGGTIEFGSDNPSHFIYGVINELGGIIQGGYFGDGGAVTNYGTISGGIFEGQTNNFGTISDGTFDGSVENGGVTFIYNNKYEVIGTTYYTGSISGGTFNGSVTNGCIAEDKTSTITGGIFNGTVENGSAENTNAYTGKIEDGYFIGQVINNKRGTVTGGHFLIDKVDNKGGYLFPNIKYQPPHTLTLVSKGGKAVLNNPTSPYKEYLEKKTGFATVGYMIPNSEGLIGLYLNEEPKKNSEGKYYIDTAAFKSLFGAAYQFTMPDEDTTVYAVYEGYSGELTVGGAIESAFNFEKGMAGQEYTFTVDNPPESLTAYEWSITGTLPAGLSLMDSDKASAYIGGTPTAVTTAPVSLTVSVSATGASGNIYEGSADILIAVNEPVNPFAAAANLLKNADCTVPMETANTKETVSTWLNDTWLSGIAGLEAALGVEADISELSVAVNNDFTAAVAGNAANPDGTNGGITFSVKYGNDLTVCDNLTCTVEAAAYNHTHSFSPEYSRDNTHHWHECTDPECDAVSGKAPHSGTDDGDCTTAVICECGYVITPANTHDFSGAYSTDETGHWHVCKNDGCAVTDTKQAHSGGTATYTERAICSVCNQPYGTTAGDTTAPTGTIFIGESNWSSAQSGITFNLFFNKPQTVTVTSADTQSGVMKTEYFLSDKKLDGFSAVQWTEYNGSFNISPDNEYIVYVRITDNAGNTAVINSNGIVLDATAPVLSGIESGKTYCGAVEVTIQEKYLETVKLNDNAVMLTDGKFTISPADGTQIVTATDKAGNSVSYNITVNGGHTWVDNECTVCHSKLLSATVNTGGNTVDIGFKPAPGVNLPIGTELVTNPYNPTGDDLEKIIGTTVPGGEVTVTPRTGVVDYEVLKRSDYTRFGVSVWDLISVFKKEYMITWLTGSETLGDVNGRVIDLEEKRQRVAYSNIGTWNIYDVDVNGKLEYEKTSELIVINGVEYIIGYKLDVGTDVEANILYLADGRAAGRFTKNTKGEMRDFVFYDDCTPKKLGGESNRPDPLYVQINKDGKTYNANLIYSSDISLASGGEIIQANGSMSISLSPSAVAGYGTNTQYMAFHLDSGVAVVGTVTETADGGRNVSFRIGGQSPFIILALTEAEPFSVPVKAVEAAEQPGGGDSPQTGDNSNLWLWIALLFVSGGAVTALGITGKRRRIKNQ